jgi:DNA-binding beta-propeller fold protein YncE
LKNQNCWRGSLRASLLFAFAILTFAAPLHAGGNPPSARATKSLKQGLWMTDALGFTELNRNQALLAFGNPPAVTGGVTFDINGNFWGTYCDAGGQNSQGLIFELTQKQLLNLKRGGRLRAAKVEFEDPYPLFDCPKALAFDKSGNLWVANLGESSGNGTIMKYSPDQLATGGKLYPATVFESVFGYIWDIKFDAAGNLWIAGDGMFGVGPEAVFELTSEQLAEPGSPYIPLEVTPNLKITSKTFAFPGKIAFDQSGNLWVGGYTTPLLAFAAGDLSGSGTISPAPLLTIYPTTVKKTNSSFYTTTGIAFDRQGNLWVCSAQNDGAAKNDNGTLAEFKSNQITGNGSPTPALFLLLSHILRGPGPLTFGPLL